MKILLSIVVLLVLGSAAQAGAPQEPARRVETPPSRYWLSDDLHRLVFWQVRAAAEASATPIDATSR